MRVQEVLQQFFQKEGVDDRVYRGKFFFFKLGPIPFAFLNPGRLHLHDLHHIALGAKTNIQGEAQVSAFELRTGSLPGLVAFYCLISCFLGFVLYPCSTILAFRRARGARNLYNQKISYQELLQENIEDLRERLHLHQEIIDSFC